MKYCDDDIKRLIPQRFPFMMVDEFESVDAQQAVTALTVRHDNYFLLPDGTLAETGLIEHMAQSCSALVGSQAQSDRAPIGMIAEVKQFSCHRRPLLDERLDTRVEFGFSYGPMTLAHCVTTIGTDPVAEGDLKIFMQ